MKRDGREGWSAQDWQDSFEYTARLAARRAATEAKPHYIYRLSDRAGVLIYVGCSVHPKQRFSQHSKDLQDATWRIETGEPMPFAEARAEEARLIADLAPLFNRAGNPTYLAAARTTQDRAKAADLAVKNRAA